MHLALASTKISLMNASQCQYFMKFLIVSHMYLDTVWIKCYISADHEL